MSLENSHLELHIEQFDFVDVLALLEIVCRVSRAFHSSAKYLNIRQFFRKILTLKRKCAFIQAEQFDHK